jgi:hypothetical protein
MVLMGPLLANASAGRETAHRRRNPPDSPHVSRVIAGEPHHQIGSNDYLLHRRLVGEWRGMCTLRHLLRASVRRGAIVLEKTRALAQVDASHEARVTYTIRIG